MLYASVSRRKRRERSVGGQRCGSQQSFSIFKIGNAWVFYSLCLLPHLWKLKPCFAVIKGYVLGLFNIIFEHLN